MPGAAAAMAPPAAATGSPMTAAMAAPPTAKVPLEVSNGAVIRLPVTLTYSTWKTQSVASSAQIGAAFEREGLDSPVSMDLKPQESRSYFQGLKVVGQGLKAEDGTILLLQAKTGSLEEGLKRVIRVVPAGFPRG